MADELDYLVLPRKAVADGATGPNPGKSFALAWSTSFNDIAWWDSVNSKWVNNNPLATETRAGLISAEDYTRLQTFVAGEVPATRKVIAGAGMSGGGDLSADVTLTAKVLSIFGKIGPVVAELGDYVASLVGNDSAVSGATVKDALQTLLTAVGLKADQTALTTGLGTKADATATTTALGTKVPTTRNMIAGAGMTGGGDCSTDRTFNVVATDASIVVAADSVGVGVISDVQHGARGGGTAHLVATTTVAGFESAADKVKVDGAVQGPASSGDKKLTRYSGTTGKLVQDSAATLDDAGLLTTAALSISGNIACGGLVDGVDISTIPNLFSSMDYQKPNLAPPGSIESGTLAFGASQSSTEGNSTYAARLDHWHPIASPTNAGLMSAAQATALAAASSGGGKYVETLATAATSYTITHNLNTLDVMITVYEVATGNEAPYCDKLRPTVNTVQLGFLAAQTANALRVIVRA